MSVFPDWPTIGIFAGIGGLLFTVITYFIFDERKKKKDRRNEFIAKNFPDIVEDTKRDVDLILNGESRGSQFISTHLFKEIVKLDKNSNIKQLEYDKELYNQCKWVVYELIPMCERYNEKRIGYELQLKNKWFKYLTDNGKGYGIDMAHIKDDLYDNIQLEIVSREYDKARRKYAKHLKELKELFPSKILPDESDFDKLVEISKQLLEEIRVLKENLDRHIQDNIIDGLIPNMEKQIGSLTHNVK